MGIGNGLGMIIQGWELETELDLMNSHLHLDRDYLPKFGDFVLSFSIRSPLLREGNKIAILSKEMLCFDLSIH